MEFTSGVRLCHTCFPKHATTLIFTPQLHPELGANLNSTVLYTMVVSGENGMSWSFTDVLCEPDNKCIFIRNLSDFFSPESINISVVASTYNIFGSGPPTYYRGK